MKFIRATKTIFKPSFSYKRGETEFYQIVIDGKPQAEIEVLPVNKLGSPEILSLFVDTRFRGSGIGRILVDKIKEIYGDIIYVRCTKESKPFWIKMGAEEFKGDMLLIK
jgi:GNAT superfamily N-acetyltransferase